MNNDDQVLANRSQHFRVTNDEQDRLIAALATQKDPESARMLRYLKMPDLSRRSDSPLAEIVERVKRVPSLRGFDEITIPEIVPADLLFDLFDFPADHPARSRSDTYFINDNTALRPHDTVFWYYYLQLPEVKERIAKQETLGAFCYGKVYRKDEIDWQHMNVFHQMGGWYLVPDSQRQLTIDDLKNVLGEIVKSIFGTDTVYRINEDTFPYTDPSLEVEVQTDDSSWVEILGGGLPKKSVLKKMGLEGYNGWAFGFGLERLALISLSLPDIRLLWSDDPRVKKQLVLGQKFAEVSKYPSVVRDISFIVPTGFVPNDYFDLVREVAGEDFVEEVKLLDSYQDEQKFGTDKVSFTYRIVYRRLDRTLTNDEVDTVHHQLEQKTIAEFGATIR